MDPLRQRAIEFERDVEEYLVDGKGLVRNALDLRTMKPFPSEFFTADLDIIRSPGADIGDYAGLMEYEDSGMASGTYLCAMVLKYHATRDPQALDRAYRTFAGIRDVFDRCQSVEPGYFCKPYGGRVTQETSSDQYIYVLTGLDRFVKVAAKRERDAAIAMIIAMSRYWFDRDYTRDHFGRPLRWPLNRFTGFAWLNYLYSGDEAMRAELERLAALPEVHLTLPFAEQRLEDLVRDYREGRERMYIEQKHGKMLLGGAGEAAQSGTHSIDACLEYNAPHRDLWLRQVEGLYQTARPFICEDGLELWRGFHDPATGKIEPVSPPEDIYGDQAASDYRIDSFAGNIKSGVHASMVAGAALTAHDYLPDPGNVRLARRILNGIGRNECSNWIDPEKQLPPAMSWHAHQYSGFVPAQWLKAYWHGRHRGYWG